MQCRHQGFHTISSSYDRGTRLLTFFRRCDECGTRLTEVGQLVYEPRFVATRVERSVANRIIEPPPTISRAVTTIEPPPKISRMQESDTSTTRAFPLQAACVCAWRGSGISLWSGLGIDS